MYLPAHFTPSNEEVQAFLAKVGAADLVTMTDRGLLATMLPLLYEPPPAGDSGAGDGGAGNAHGSRGRLLGHLARANDQWRETALGETLVIARGPDAYVTPTWYATKREHGRVVPTWNYVTVHFYGRLVVHDDPAWVEDLVRRLTDHHERDHAHPWSVDDAPAAYIAGQLRAIVGVEIVVTRLEAKFKLSQNRSAADVDGVVAGLEEGGARAMAQAVDSASRRSRPSRP